MIYNKPDYSTGVWAENGNIVYPSSEKIEQGHIVEKPYYEVMNYLQNRVDVGMAYVLQNGLPEWDRLTTYPVEAYVKHDSIVYKSLSQNVDSEPSSTSEIWIQAFASHQEFLTYVEEIRKIKDEDGYLQSYVSKQQPVMYGKVQGVGYLANSGLISTGDEDVGYSFNQHQRDGIFHDGDSAVAMNDGVIVGKFTDVVEPKSYVTVELLEKYLAETVRYKVGDLYLTTNPLNPVVVLGYGSWQAYAEGRALVGVSNANSTNPEWTKYVGGIDGVWDVNLTIEQIPSHTHSVGEGSINPISTSDMIYASGDDKTSLADSYSETKPTGGSQPHTNTQPSIAIYVWRRTA